MIPEVGSTALFTFKQKFDTLNGVYRIRAETTFRDATSAGVDFVENFYTPAGLSATEFNADYAQYLSDRIAVLESVVDTEAVYYAPESAFLTVPDPTIKEYFNLIAVLGLGVYSNTQEILAFLDQVTDLAQSSLGITNPLQVVTNPNNKVYLTDAQYDQVQTARAENIVKMMPLSLQLRRAEDQIAVLAARCAEYEKKIAKQVTS